MRTQKKHKVNYGTPFFQVGKRLRKSVFFLFFLFNKSFFAQLNTDTAALFTNRTATTIFISKEIKTCNISRMIYSQELVRSEIRRKKKKTSKSISKYSEKYSIIKVERPVRKRTDSFFKPVSSDDCLSIRYSENSTFIIASFHYAGLKASNITDKYSFTDVRAIGLSDCFFSPGYCITSDRYSFNSARPPPFPT